MAPVDLPREEPERSKAAGSSAAQSRRAKNAAHRADDVGLYQLSIGVDVYLQGFAQSSHSKLVADC
jgi:hypothetical protein